ncbi:glycoside hydrolase family 30 beta sandwich domain-containing protein [Anaerocolumna sp. AGMB13025]|uniref:glycoside hydrolase family 30 protein n=1 Tax=Anaerocolumna sp. AGMB13025 TaxID=3039116 RepID=UPI00241D7674|nr:glycoside hydrolase family 30 beta sandwich domain-containing protein [Anaerocolumna sp. AGMB13025]WFR55743.1 glycoside hydrolase family 30 beta sandwich domain-containing protein [Anaerocolumna sp. AGMB13025]
MNIYTSNAEQQMVRTEKEFYTDYEAENKLIKVYAEEVRQEILGFGGALTEAAAYTYYRMSKEKQEKLTALYFGEQGNNYNFCRLHIQSCDFSLGNNSYVTDEADTELNSFSISQDEKYVIPYVKEALSKNPEIQFLGSPWSPPAFMKSNGEMNQGGRLLEEYYEPWAKVIVRYLKEYKKQGIEITRLTVQNEPKAVQKWDSCIFTAEEEKRFACDYLKKELIKQGLSEVKINIWDHNKERVYDRARASISGEEAYAAIDGVAFHWYSGDHFEALQLVRDRYPEKELLFSEGCAEYSKYRNPSQVSVAEHYAHDMIGNLNSGMNAYMDWNVILDSLGGPNHVNNFCDAPVMCDVENDEIEVKLSYYYIGHFSRFIKKGARRVVVSRYTDQLEVTAFVNPEGEKVVLVLNKTETSREFKLWDNDNICDLTICPHSIMTIVY